MKRQIMSAKDFRKNIFKALDDIAENLTPYILTKNGEPVAMVMNIEEIEALAETYDVLADEQLMKQINYYKKHKRQKLSSWNKVKREL